MDAVTHDPRAWAAAAEWQRVEAQYWKPTHRRNLRSWGVPILEPPGDDVKSIGASPGGMLEIAPLKYGCVRGGCRQPAAPDSNYCLEHAPGRRRATCTHTHWGWKTGFGGQEIQFCWSCGKRRGASEMPSRAAAKCGRCDHLHPDSGSCDYADAVVGPCACPSDRSRCGRCGHEHPHAICAYADSEGACTCTLDDLFGVKVVKP